MTDALMDQPVEASFSAQPRTESHTARKSEDGAWLCNRKFGGHRCVHRYENNACPSQSIGLRCCASKLHKNEVLPLTLLAHA